MPRLTATLAAAAALGAGIGAAGIATADDRDRGDRDHRDDYRGDQRGDRGWPRTLAVVVLRDAAGDRVGTAFLRERRRSGTVSIAIRAEGLTPGFHGFHVHETGVCQPPFTSAGGHYDPADAPHGAHAGDLPSLLVTEQGTAALATTTDRFSLAELRAGDGSALMIHSGPDNFANIPARYGGPDAETLATGDSGTRVACGVIR